MYCNRPNAALDSNKRRASASQAPFPRGTSYDEQVFHSTGSSRRPPGVGAAAAAQTSPPATTFVRGFRGEPQGGFQGVWGTHLGEGQMFGVRQKKGVAEMEWKSAPLPTEIRGDSVTFVLTGAMGSGPGGGSFTIFVNGHAAADCDAVLESTQFPAGQELPPAVRRPLHLQRAGVLRALLPDRAQGVGQGGPGGGPSGQSHGRGRGDVVCVAHADDAPLAIPDHDWTVLIHAASAKAGTPPPPGEEASYDWYRRQYYDPVVFTPIGPPADPTETAVMPSGQLARPLASTRSQARIIPSTARHSACGKTVRRRGWAWRAPCGNRWKTATCPSC